MIRAVLFDVDGVLMDSFEANYAFYSWIFEKLGRHFVSRDESRTMVHMTMQNVFRTTLDPATAEHAMAVAQEAPRPIDLFVRPDNCDDVLRSLKERYALGIVTSRGEKGTATYFRFSQDRELFATVIHHGLYTEPKPSPVPLLLAAKELGIPPEDIVYVGDTLYDKQAATAAGMQFILYGKTESGHHVESFAELEEMIDFLDKPSAQDS